MPAVALALGSVSLLRPVRVSVFFAAAGSTLGTRLLERMDARWTSF